MVQRVSVDAEKMYGTMYTGSGRIPRYHLLISKEPLIQRICNNDLKIIVEYQVQYL